MSSSHFGLSNHYVKLGAALMFAGLVAIAFTSFFSTEVSLQATVRNLGLLSLLSGAVVFTIGRVVQAKRSRAQA